MQKHHNNPYHIVSSTRGLMERVDMKVRVFDSVLYIIELLKCC